MDPHVDTVVFSPYSLAFARHHLPEGTMEQLFELNVLIWEVQPQSSPVFKIGGIVCPFLTLRWDAKAKELFQNNLEKIANSESPEFQLILVGILHVLTTIYYDYLRKTGLRDVDVGMPVHGLITVFIAVWERLAFDRPELYPEDIQGKYLVDFYEFLRKPPDPERMFKASCGIWPARPQVCRIFPLGRWIALEDNTPDNQVKLKKQKVLLQDKICPPKAFKKEEPRNAAQFIKEQGAEGLEYSIFRKMSKLIQQCPDYISSLTPEGTQHLYKNLLLRMYYAVDYKPDEKEFYRELHDQLDEFIVGFNELYQRIKQEAIKNE
jgi:hypothetical protein